VKVAELFRKPSPEELMTRELDMARRSLLEAMSMREYYDAIVRYHEQRIDRLRSMLDQSREREE
jgi:hypothetical protein